MNKKAPRASIYQRKSDMRWVGSISMGKKPDGSRYRMPPVYGDTEDDVRAKVNIMLYELQTEQYIIPTKDSLIDFLKEYHKACSGYDAWNKDISVTAKRKKKWEKTTAQLFKMYIDVHFAPYFKNTKLKQVTPIILDEYYNYKLTTEREYTVKQGSKIVTKKKAPLGINTVIKLHKFLSAAFNYAITNDLLRKNPTIGTNLSSAEDFEPTVYDEEQFLKLIEYVRGTDDEIPIILGAGCGLRRGEILGLRWGDVDYKNKTISIETTITDFNEVIEKIPKSKKSKRTLIVPDYVIDILFIYYRTKSIGNELNISDKIVTRWKPRSLSDRFSYLLNRFELDPTRLHDLRHFNAVIMLKTDIPDRVAAERLGHSQNVLRKTYQHVQRDMDQNAANKINNILKPHEHQEPDDPKPPILDHQEPERSLSREERKALFKIAK